MISTIIFDFDGVILESVSVKTEAFRELFSFAPEHVSRIVQYHIENGGMSRFEKFRHIYKNIIREPLTDEKCRQLSQRFSDIVEEKVAAAPFVKGAEDFLKSAFERYDFYIVSATPQNELIRIIRKRKILHYFKGVYGSPTGKSDHMAQILLQNNLNLSEVVFVGDAVNDWEAARRNNIPFIARIRPGDKNRFTGLNNVECTIEDFEGLGQYLNAFG